MLHTHLSLTKSVRQNTLMRTPGFLRSLVRALTPEQYKVLQRHQQQKAARARDAHEYYDTRLAIVAQSVAPYVDYSSPIENENEDKERAIQLAAMRLKKLRWEIKMDVRFDARGRQDADRRVREVLDKVSGARDIKRLVYVWSG